jgi:general stress protein CsbA
MKSKLEKLIDLKSIITILLVATLVFLVLYSAVTGKNISNDIFLLFSNIITMVVTYFFTKKKEAEKDA